MTQFSPLRKELSKYLSRSQIKRIFDTYVFSAKAHHAQSRESGERYITHPIAVATILAKMHMDEQSITAALLHDVLEDTNNDKESLAKLFGTAVANLVDGVSKLEQISFTSHAEAQAENFRKMLMAMAGDIRVILIKLADRLHNMRTLEYLDDAARRNRIAKETLEIYAPIAHRLGMNDIKIELEELGFATCFPHRYRAIQAAVKRARGNRKELISTTNSIIKKALSASKIKNFELLGREKHSYSIYKKMRDRHLRFAEITDIYAFRIIVPTVDDCYRVLGILHNTYRPLLNRFKDYIAIPKANGYQSLHTVLLGQHALPIEVQIRTTEMDSMANNGIAAHWLYKTEKNVLGKAQLRAREWVKELLEIQQNAGNSLEFIEHVKADLFPDEIYVFTPNGKIIELPAGATPIDFAYKVHSDIGNKCIAVEINGIPSPLSTILNSGETVKILVSNDALPNPAWLDFVVTSKARSCILAMLKQIHQTDSVNFGKQMIAKALASYQLTLDEIPKKNFDNVLRTLKQYHDLNELFAAVGVGDQLAPIIAWRLSNRGEDQPNLITQEPLKIKGSEGMKIKFAKCCRPIPGDVIVGTLSKEHGVVVHSANCINLKKIMEHKEKYIPLRWENNVKGEFEVELHVWAMNTRGILATLALEITNSESNVDNIVIEERDGKFLLFKLIISVRDRFHLAKIIRRIRRLPNITKVVRYRNIMVH